MTINLHCHGDEPRVYGYYPETKCDLLSGSIQVLQVIDTINCGAALIVTMMRISSCCFLRLHVYCSWLHSLFSVDLDDSTYSVVTNGEARSLSSTCQSEEGTPNFMTATLRPGEFGTMMQTMPPEPPKRGSGLPPLARQRMGKSVTFASQDEFLADSTRADSDAEGATLTEISNASSSMEMSSLRRSLPSGSSEGVTGKTETATPTLATSTDYDDDFENDDDDF